MKLKLIISIILLAAIVVGLSGCVSQTPSTPFDTTPIQSSPDVKFYTASGVVGKMQINMAQPNNVYNLLIGLPTGWYTLDSTPKKVYGFVDNNINMVNRELSVYYVGTLLNGQKVAYSITIHYDTPTQGIVETFTPKDQGYSFTIEANPNKTPGFY